MENPQHNNILFTRFKKKSLALVYAILSETLYILRTIKYKKLRDAITTVKIVTMQIRGKFSTYSIQAHNNQIAVLEKINDTQIVSGSLDSLIRLWELTKGICLKTFKGHSKAVVGLIKLFDTHLISGSWDMKIRVWVLKTGECINSFLAHSEGLCWLKAIFTTQIASISSEECIKIWDFSSPSRYGKTYKTFIGHFDIILCLEKLNSNLIASGGMNKYQITIWYMDTQKIKSTINAHEKSVEMIIKLDDRRFVSASSDTTLKIWDFTTNNCLNTIQAHDSDINGLLKLNETQIASGGKDKKIKIWNFDTGECVNELTGHKDTAFYLIKMNEFVLVSGGEDGAIKIWLI